MYLNQISSIFHSTTIAEKFEQFEEQHHDIDVEKKCTNDVVVIAERVLLASCNKLGVVDQEETVEHDEECSNEWVPPGNESQEEAANAKHQ